MKNANTKTEINIQYEAGLMTKAERDKRLANIDREIRGAVNAFLASGKSVTRAQK